MRFLVDENIPDSVAKFLAARGHDVDLVRDRLGQMTPDEYIAWVGDDMGAVVLTIDRDFSRIIERVGSKRRFNTVGRISLRCRESRALARIQDFIEEIETEHDRAQTRRDKRLIIEITDTSYRVIR